MPAGRPSYKPTKEQREVVRRHIACGTKQDDLCALLGIDPKTLRKHFGKEIATASVEANVAVAHSLFRQAVGSPAQFDENGNMIRAEATPVPSCGIFWMKARAKWREGVELTGADGGPIKTEEVSARERVARRIAGLTPGG